MRRASNRNLTAGLAACLLAGCLPLPAPPLSTAHLAQFGRGVEGRDGSVVVSTGLLGYQDQIGPGYSLATFPVEAGITLRPLPSYQVSALAGSAQLHLEGNYALLQREDLRLGLIHGLGAGAFGPWPGLSALFSATGGLFAEVPLGSRSSLFASGRYSFSAASSVDTWQLGVGTLGCALRVRGLELAPELVAGRAWSGSPDSRQWFAAASLTVAAPFSFSGEAGDGSKGGR